MEKLQSGDVISFGDEPSSLKSGDVIPMKEEALASGDVVSFDEEPVAEVAPQEKPSGRRLYDYGRASTQNDVADLADIATAVTGMGARMGLDDDGNFFYHSAEDQFGPEWKSAGYDRRIELINEAQDRELAEEFPDVHGSGYEDSWQAQVGGGVSMALSPTSLLPASAAYKVGSAGYKTARGAKVARNAYVATTSAAYGAAYAGETSLLKQLADEGTVDGKRLAAEMAMAAAISPVLLGGAAVVGKNVRMFKNRGANDVSKMSKSRARALYLEMEDDLIHMWTSTAPDGMVTDKIIGLDGKYKAYEISLELSKKYQQVFLGGDDFLKKAGRAEWPEITKASAMNRKILAREGPAGYGEALRQKAEWFAGATDTRMENISPAIAGRVRHTDLNIKQRTVQAEDVVTKMKNEFENLNNLDTDSMMSMLQDRNWGDVDTLLRANGNEAAADAMAKVKLLLEETGEESLNHGIISLSGKNKRVDEYFPWHVKDLDGWYEALNIKEKNVYDEALKVARKAKGKEAKLTNFERAEIANKVLQRHTSPTLTARKTTSGQERVWKDRIPQKMKPYYHNPIDSLFLYFRETIDEIETRKFFGKINKEKVKGAPIQGPLPKGTKNRPKIKATNLVPDSEQKIIVDQSVGNLISEHKLNQWQALEMQSLLTSRFGPGRRQASPYIANTKSGIYAALIANPISAIQQFGDSGISMIVNGYGATARSAISRASKSITKTNQILDTGKDFGIASAAHDIETGGLHAFLTKSLRRSGFTKADTIMKNLNSESAVRKAWKQALTPAGTKDIYARYAPAWGDKRATQLIHDLRATAEDGVQMTPLMKEYAANELIKVQPVTHTALPQAYLDHPDGRLAYTLLTFNLRLLDVMRREAYNVAANGNPVKGAARLAEAMLVMGTLGAGIDYVQDWGQGRITRIADLPVRVAENALNTLFINKFGIQDFGTKPMTAATSGFVSNPAGNVGDTVLAPVGQALSGDMEGFKETGRKALRMWPVYGKVLESWINRGEYNEALKDKWAAEKEGKIMKGMELDDEALPSLEDSARLPRLGG